MWKPAAVIDRVACTALSRNGTVHASAARATVLLLPRHTAAAIAYHRVQRRYQVGHDGVGVVQPSKNRDDVGAGVGVLLGQGGVEEDGQGLAGGKPTKLLRVWATSNLESEVIRRQLGLLDAEHGAADELLRMRLLVEHVVGRNGVQDTLETGCVWPVEEEFLPEAFRQLAIVVFVLDMRLASCLAHAGKRKLTLNRAS